MSHVGPFVTDVHSLGNGKIVFERCYLESTYRGDVTGTRGCTTRVVDVNESSVAEN